MDTFGQAVPLKRGIPRSLKKAKSFLYNCCTDESFVKRRQMQARSAFVGPSILPFTSRSRRLLLSPGCTLVDRGVVSLKSASLPLPSAYEEPIHKYLRELSIHYNTYRTTGRLSPSSADFLQDFSRLLKRYDGNVVLPSEPTLANLSVNGEYYLWAKRILSKIRQSNAENNTEALDGLFRQPDIIGTVRRRNSFYLGIPHKYLRAHEAFHALPTSFNVQIDSCESLRSLRQDCEPFLAAWQALPLHANEVWPLLGFGEENSVSALLPPACRGHKHALRIWKKLVSSGSARTRKRTFHERFAHERVANAALSYMSAERNRWTSLAPTAPPWCDAVQLLETGCWVHKEARLPLAAASVARVVRRNEDDFWMWGAIDTILIAKAEDMYPPSSGFQCRFQRPKARNELDLLSWVEAQFSMLCSGRKIRFADVVWYATLGGVSVFRVKRDDAFLLAGLEALETFALQFVEEVCPPHAGFEQGQSFQCLTERIGKRFEAIDRLAYVSAVVAETRLIPWRRRMNDWETQRGKKPFF